MLYLPTMNNNLIMKPPYAYYFNHSPYRLILQPMVLGNLVVIFVWNNLFQSIMFKIDFFNFIVSIMSSTSYWKSNHSSSHNRPSRHISFIFTKAFEYSCLMRSTIILLVYVLFNSLFIRFKLLNFRYC